MAKINITGFGGIAPKKHKRFLGENGAQVAENCKLVSGALESWREPKYISQLAKAGDIKTIYKFGSIWLHWTQDVDVVRGAVSGVERLYFTGTDAPRVTDATLADQGGNDEYPEATYLLGIPAPTTAPTATLVGTHTSPQDTGYVYTFVSAWGEEGPPSPPSNTVAADFATGTVDLTTMDAAPVGDYNITKWRIYRINVGGAGAEYQFVDEVVINASSPQYNDSTLAANLAEVLPSTLWYPPQTSLKGLTRMAGGLMAGFVGNTVYFCEPYLPHAWNPDYSYTVDDDIVALASYGNTLVVLTEAFPVLMTGTDPSRMSSQTLTIAQPCINKRGVVSLENGVAFYTHNGVYFIGRDGHRLLTEQEIDYDAWSDNNPASGNMEQYNGRLMCFFDFTGAGYVFGPKDESRRLRTINLTANASFYNKDDGGLYFVTQENGFNNLYQFDAGGNNMNYVWRSGLIPYGRKIKFTAGKIYAKFNAALSPDAIALLEAERAAVAAANQLMIDNDQVRGALNDYAVNEEAINSDNLAVVPSLPNAISFIFRVYTDGALSHEAQIENGKPFRLPNMKGLDYEIEISGSYPVHQTKIATSVRELA